MLKQLRQIKELLTCVSPAAAAMADERIAKMQSAFCRFDDCLTALPDGIRRSMLALFASRMVEIQAPMHLHALELLVSLDTEKAGSQGDIAGVKAALERWHNEMAELADLYDVD